MHTQPHIHNRAHYTRTTHVPLRPSHSHRTPPTNHRRPAGTKSVLEIWTAPALVRLSAVTVVMPGLACHSTSGMLPHAPAPSGALWADGDGVHERVRAITASVEVARACTKQVSWPVMVSTAPKSTAPAYERFVLEINGGQGHMWGGRE
jgi:hypothetical protein